MKLLDTKRWRKKQNKNNYNNLYTKYKSPYLFVIRYMYMMDIRKEACVIVLQRYMVFKSIEFESKQFSYKLDLLTVLAQFLTFVFM